MTRLPHAVLAASLLASPLLPQGVLAQGVPAPAPARPVPALPGATAPVAGAPAPAPVVPGPAAVPPAVPGAVAPGVAAPIAAPAPAPRPVPAPRPARAPSTVDIPIRAPALTLGEAEAMLLDRNLAVVAARRGVDITRAQRLVADTNPAGSLGYSQTTAQVNERSRFSGYNGGRYVSPLNNASVNLSFTIERGGKRELRRRLADQNISVAEAQVLDALRGQLFALRQAFIAALQARANLQVALANRGSLNGTEGLLSRQVRDGAIPEADLLRFQASRLPFEQDVANAAQAYAVAAAQVAALLGQDATRTSEAAARSTGRDPVAAILAGMPFDLRGDFTNTPPLDMSRETLAGALPNRPDVLVATRNVSAADANTQLAEAARSRDLSVSGSVTRTELSQDLPESSRRLRANDTLGIGVSIPIFTSRITEGNIAVANAQRGQAQAQAQAALASAQADLAVAWATYVQARALLDLTTGAALRRAEEAYRSTEAAYLAGGRTLLDTLDALRTLNQTRVAANAARAAYLNALAGLEQAAGVEGIAPRL
ncbi:TolC family protein [Roseomonas populi]|uniref:TolC family protein n=1 Tax=Roseomonas populi TaxID=3121582 RepID=A0ABT1X244_9PROT|nr:TolC family protein [Roseomonas pecuniae]MCR0982163.1 TolC family protein [Roseomonas pecuniae]